MISSKYTVSCILCGRRILSMSHWNISGAPNDSNRLINWCNLNGAEKTVFFLWILESRESTNTPWEDPVSNKSELCLTKQAIHQCEVLNMCQIWTNLVLSLLVHTELDQPISLRDQDPQHYQSHRNLHDLKGRLK